jgi:hypothetical protein
MGVTGLRWAMQGLAWRLVARVQRVIGAILVVGVLLGGIFPVLYGDLLPHEHLFFGGAPPVNWEQHEHPNPVLIILGRASATTVGRAALAPGTTLALVDRPVRIVSVYAGPMGIVASLVALVVILPAMRPAALLTDWTTIELAGHWWHIAMARGPLPPPPRTS